jgi:3-deoxy-D-manno-octulosonic-acid transferase
VRIGSLFNGKAKKFVKGRRRLWKDIEHIDPEDELIWFHCASLGEFEQGRPLIEKIKEHHPSYKLLITFFSPSGYEIRKNYEFADYITYLPIDTPWKARRFVKKVNPQKAIFVKYEFWYFILRELHKYSIDTYLISSVFRKNQFFFRWYGKKFRQVLDWFKIIFVQNQDSLQLLKSYNYQNVILSGDTRFDRVLEISSQAVGLPLINKFKAERLTLIAGSTWKKDEELIFRYFTEHEKPFKMVIAPHEVDDANIERICSELQAFDVVKLSEAKENDIDKKDVLIIDSIGLLSSLYQYGEFSYIGGGFGKGIHNLLEAATWGLPVVFGPNHQKFNEAFGLKQTGGGFDIQNYETLNNIFNQLIDDPEFREKSAKAAKKYIDQHAGATDLILKHIF